MQIDSQKLDRDTVVLNVKGDLDAFSVSAFRQAAARHRESPRLIIELRSGFIDSAGLNALVGTVRRIHEQNGGAAVVCTARVSELLTIAGFDRMVRLNRTVEEARIALH